MAYFLFTKAILEGRSIDIYNRGQMQRDFTYIDDIVEGIVAATDHESTCALFNLGNHQPESLLYFIEILEQELGIEAKKNWLDMQAGDVVATYADIALSTDQLSFTPKVSLAEGLHRFIKWYKAYYLV